MTNRHTRYQLPEQWPTDAATARDVQRELAKNVLIDGEAADARLIAGVDASYTRDGRGRAAAVLLRYPSLEVRQTAVVEGRAAFPYVPGLLSFREIPLVLRALDELDVIPDLIIADGQGLAHPRRFGLACHLGVLLDLPVIGCAKSRLIGESPDLPNVAGEAAPLVQNGEQIGWTLRSRPGSRPLYVSPGHRVSMEASLQWIRRLLAGYRLPEPTRQADFVASERRKAVKWNQSVPAIVDDTDTR